MEYQLGQLKGGEWYVLWSFETNGDICRCQREYKRKTNAMIFLARLKDGHYSMQQQFKWCRERKGKTSS